MKNTYGPYTPQETERLVEELKRLNVDFELSKDEDEEKNFSRSDFTNIVTRAEYRTESYLAQIFYFLLAPQDDSAFQTALLKVGLRPAEVGGENLEVSPEEERLVQSAAVAHKKKQRLVATVLILIFVLPIVFVVLQDLFSK